MLKQAKINTIKCLRKFTDHSKTSFEYLFKENYDLKKRVLDMDTQIRILKVALAKSHKKLKKNGGLEKIEESFNSYGSGVRASDLLPRLQASKSPSLGVSAASGKLVAKAHGKSRMSTSTAASDSNEERLAMELAALKKEVLQKDHDSKVQLARMKTFYDKHLLELNQLKMNMPVSVKKSEPKHEEIQKYEVELRGLRSKIQSMKDDSRKYQEKLDEKESKITDLRNRIANQGFTKLSKAIEDLNVELAAAKAIIAEKDLKIAEINNLEYQINKACSDGGGFIKSVVTSYLKAKQNGLQNFLTESAKNALSFLNTTIYSRIGRLVRSLYLMFEDRVLSSVTDTKKIMTSMVDQWRTEKGEGLVQDTLEENALLKQQISDINDDLNEAKVKLDMMIRTRGAVLEQIVDKEKFVSMAFDYKELSRQLDLEEEMPEHIKDEIKKLRLEHCQSKVSSL